MRAHTSLSALFVFWMLAVAGCGGSEDAGSSSAPPPAGSVPPSAPSSATTSATLQWSAPGDARVQGYRVYYGTGSRAYVQGRGAGLDAAANASYVVTNLQSGRTYYFAVTAYDAAGNESDYSVEVTKVVE